jgi:hypothetical protein
MPSRRERRAEADRLARALLAAKTEREQVEAELQRTQSWRFRRRTELERRLDSARTREQGLLSALGGHPRE